MPWEETDNEIRHRLKDPGGFQEGSFRTIPVKKDKPRIWGIAGRLKGESTLTLQALRFPKDDGWTMGKAKDWWAKHKDSFKTDAEDVIEYKSFALDVKSASDQGQITGIAAVYGTEDLQGDIIERGAFTKTLQDNPEVPILWQHDAREVIGQATLEDTGKRLLLHGQLDMDDPSASKVFGKLKKGLIKGLSIGFQAIKVTWEEAEKQMIRHIDELKLWEVSIVTFPAIPQAQVTGAKQFISALLRESESESLPEPGADETKEAAKSSDEPVDYHSALQQIKETLQWK